MAQSVIALLISTPIDVRLLSLLYIRTCNMYVCAYVCVSVYMIMDIETHFFITVITWPKLLTTKSLNFLKQRSTSISLLNCLLQNVVEKEIHFMIPFSSQINANPRNMKLLRSQSLAGVATTLLVGRRKLP